MQWYFSSLCTLFFFPWHSIILFVFFLSYFEFISLFSSFFSLQKYLRDLKPKQQQQTPSAWSCSLSEVKTICFIHSYISSTKNNSGHSRLRNKISGKSIKVKCYFILGGEMSFWPLFLRGRSYNDSNYKFLIEGLVHLVELLCI